MAFGVRAREPGVMPTYRLTHQHEPEECRIAWAAWKGFDSPLRHQITFGSCAEGGHTLWWIVDAENAPAALDQVPPYVAERTRADRVSEVRIP
jgi:hypothetical protein